MKIKPWVILCGLAVVLFSCQSPRTKTMDALQGVSQSLTDLRQDLHDANNAITNAQGHLDTATTQTSNASKGAAQDSKDLKKSLDQYTSLRSSPWVRFILFIRKWFYIVLTSYLVLGIASGILFGRNIAAGLAGHVLDLLPAAQIFKFIGGIFRKRAT